MKITADASIDRAKPEEQPKFISLLFDQIVQALNGRLSISDNFDAKILTVTFSAANIDFFVPHGLGRVPSAYIQAGSTAATNIYDGSVGNSAQLICLRASAASTVRLVVF